MKYQFCNKKCPILSYIYFLISIQIKVIAQTLGVGRDFLEAHFFTKCNKKQKQYDYILITYY